MCARIKFKIKLAFEEIIKKKPKSDCCCFFNNIIQEKKNKTTNCLYLNVEILVFVWTIVEFVVD